MPRPCKHKPNLTLATNGPTGYTTKGIEKIPTLTPTKPSNRRAVRGGIFRKLRNRTLGASSRSGVTTTNVLTAWKGLTAFEKIKTEAGEFEAYRIKLAGWWTNPSRNITGRESVSIHFAPAIKKFVKWDNSSRTSNGMPWNDVEMELVKWEPKAQLPANLTVPKPAAQ